MDNNPFSQFTYGALVFMYEKLDMDNEPGIFCGYAPQIENLLWDAIQTKIDQCKRDFIARGGKEILFACYIPDRRLV